MANHPAVKVQAIQAKQPGKSFLRGLFLVRKPPPEPEKRLLRLDLHYPKVEISAAPAPRWEDNLISIGTVCSYTRQLFQPQRSVSNTEMALTLRTLPLGLAKILYPHLLAVLEKSESIEVRMEAYRLCSTIYLICNSGLMNEVQPK